MFMQKLLIIVSALLLVSCSDKNVISISTEMIDYSISDEGGKIIPVSYYDKITGRDIIRRDDTIPYFEFSTNRGIISSNLPVWRHTKSQKRKLGNGGTEIKTFFIGKDIAQGLEVVLEHQFFPNSGLIRERLSLRTKEGESILFSNIDGHNYFRHSSYSISGNLTSCKEWRIATYMKENHIFTSAEIKHDSQKAVMAKGPFMVTTINGEQIISSYEHASQDKAVVRGKKCGNGLWSEKNQKHIRDITDDDYWFIGTQVVPFDNYYNISQKILRGAYIENESIPDSSYYQTAWTTINILPDTCDCLNAIRHYILSQITENPVSRRPTFYYNTWGMQRDAGKQLREVFNDKRILREIKQASQLGVDCFVFDDGWQENIGVWTPNTARISSFDNLIENVKSYGMKPGAWLSLAAMDTLSERYLFHPDWVIRDTDGQPIHSQYRQAAGDIIGDFYYALKEDHIKLIDKGIRLFKWDALNTFHSYQINQRHGTDNDDYQERIDRYNYLFPFRITQLMRELREYNPDVEVEIDITEPERALIGLMPLQEGRFFWFNNGASKYGDYSTKRTKSSRHVISPLTQILPPEVINYASYPHNVAPFYAQEYNVNSIFISGRGLWGNLDLMSDEERLKVGSMVSRSKIVLPHLYDIPLKHIGAVGDAPEVYWQINKTDGYGQVIGFSSKEYYGTFSTEVNPDMTLIVLNTPYSIKDGQLSLPLSFETENKSISAFIIGNNGKNINIISSSGRLSKVEIKEDRIIIEAIDKGMLTAKINSAIEYIDYSENDKIEIEI